MYDPFQNTAAMFDFKAEESKLIFFTLVHIHKHPSRSHLVCLYNQRKRSMQDDWKAQFKGDVGTL